MAQEVTELKIMFVGSVDSIVKNLTKTVTKLNHYREVAMNKVVREQEKAAYLRTSANDIDELARNLEVEANRATKIAENIENFLAV